MPTTRARRLAAEASSPSWPRRLAFAATAVAVLGAGVALATGDLLGPRGASTEAESIPVRMSMAGYDPARLLASPGETLLVELWTTDAAPHLEGGVHTFISDELGIYEELAAESRRTFELTAPTVPGVYDFYCDTCCGGKASPSMHGQLVVEA